MPDPEPTPEPTPEPEPTPDPPPAQEPDWKAEARKWEKRAKENTDAAARLAALEDAQKTDQDKLQDRLDLLEQEHRQSTTEAARLKVALKKGLDEVQARRLVGETSEELEADADELLASFNTSAPPPPASRNQGSDGGAPDVNPDQLAEQIWNAHRI